MTDSAPLRILLVDDERHIRGLMRQLIEMQGGEVIAEAADGEAAIEQNRLYHPDLIFLDINMPKLNGDLALPRLVADAPDAVIIMLSAQNTLETVENCIEAGAWNYILKGTPLAELIQMLEESWPEYLAECRRRRP